MVRNISESSAESRDAPFLFLFWRGEALFRFFGFPELSTEAGLAFNPLAASGRLPIMEGVCTQTHLQTSFYF